MAIVIDATTYGSGWALHFWTDLPVHKAAPLLQDLPVSVRTNYDASPKCPNSACKTKVVMGGDEDIRRIRGEVYRRLSEA